ncbi:hypothetical protein SEPCBS57363_005130 [Sporothrix epigloea]|uniref:Nonsense-mediated mRNA decay factor n=1 Tax=Sporothrix epigloea TaxID=1892477 RepID=A0ABP0DVW9_9PEZI
MANTSLTAAQEASETEAHWLEAKKITHSIVKKLEQVDKDESGSKKLLAELEAVEHLLESLRLACMATTFTDFKFAHQNRVLDRLWHIHTLISAEYKKGLHRHRGHGQIVQFRTIEKQYAKHLKTAQYFYRGFVERLSARYHLRSLQRVAHTMHSSNLKISDVVDAEEAQLSHELTVACYRTVLHMGDIARYRLNASRHKGHNPEVAMTYYALAQDLMPKEGDAHHQMAVVLAEQRRDFDVVYHFLRSWSVQKPFALAPKNLASEFKRLLQPPSNSRKQGGAPPDAFEMFGSWLVRLHANYFKGEDFSSQSELEREVLHRWDALLKKTEQPQYLQKSVLLSLAAYDTALRRVQEEWTAASSQSCQFILQFIVRIILAISRELETEAEHLLEDPVSGDITAATPSPAPVEIQLPTLRSHDKNQKFEKNDKYQKSEKSARGSRNRSGGNDNKAATVTSPEKHYQATASSISGTCLPLFRVCMAWISIHKQDLVNFEEYLKPYIADMHRSVTRCLTLFIGLIAKTDASPTNYLLPEDVEVIGLAPLDSWTALHKGDASSPYKPHLDEEGVDRKCPRYEQMARLYDIVECTVDLIAYKPFPWLLQTVQVDGRETTTITYSEDRPCTPMASVPAAAPAVSAPYVAAPTSTATADLSHEIMHSPPSQAPKNECEVRQPVHYETAALSSVPFAAFSVVQASQAAAHPANGQTVIGQPIHISSNSPQHQTSGPMAPPRCVSYKDVDDDNFLPGSIGESQLTKDNSDGPKNYNLPAEPFNSDLDLLESAAYSRVANFLSPPKLHNHHVQPSPLQTSLPPPSSYGMHTSTIEDVFGQLQTPSSVGVPKLPTTTAGTTKPIPSSPWGGSSYMSALGYYPQQQDTAYGYGGLNRPPTNIEDQLAYLTLAKQQERQRAAAAAASSLHTTATTPSYSMDNLGRGFPSALSPVGALKQQQRQYSQSSFIDGVKAGGFSKPWAPNSNSGNAVQSEGRLLSQQQAQAGPLDIGGTMSAGSGFSHRGNQQDTASTPAMLYSSNFSTNYSMPSVQSPRGLTFNNKSSGTPETRPGDMQQPQQMQQMQHFTQMQQSLGQDMQATAGLGGYGGGRAFPNNNMWQDAWGRGVAREDNLTQFRNSVRHSGLMDETNTYDRNALLSALDDKNGHAHQR